jgi:hypothetical protein
VGAVSAGRGRTRRRRPPRSLAAHPTAVLASSRAARAATALASAAALATSTAVLAPAAATAADAHPCAKATEVAWSPDPVQSCPLIALQPDGAPLYATPVPNAAGATPPRPDGWVKGPDAADFVCDRDLPDAVFHHPQGWRNRWWAYTRSAEGVWGWVPEVYFRGGDDDEGDAGLRRCPAPQPPPPTPQPTPPAPEPTPPPPPVVAPDPCAVPSPATDLRLQARVGGRRRVLTRFGRALTARGRLTDAAGAPLANATICVLARPDTGGTRAHRVATIATDGAGAFSFPLEPGTSRIVRFVHRAGDRGAVASVAVRVRAPLSLRASRRRLRPGATVTLAGRLAEPARRRGVLVELQARRGAGFQTFATTRTGKDGGFRYGYRFSSDGGSYALRARVPRQAAFPFATGATRAVRVRIGG